MRKIRLSDPQTRSAVPGGNEEENLEEEGKIFDHDCLGCR